MFSDSSGLRSALKKSVDKIKRLEGELAEKDAEFEIQLKATDKKVIALSQEVENQKRKNAHDKAEAQHCVKMINAQNEQADKKRLIEFERSLQTEVGEIKDEYREKLEGDLHVRDGEMREIYHQLLKLLAVKTTAQENKTEEK